MHKPVFSSNSPAWLAAVEFHGHACPCVAIGCRMALAAVHFAGTPAGNKAEMIEATKRLRMKGKMELV